jgi:hypothetical protein
MYITPERKTRLCAEVAKATKELVAAEAELEVAKQVATALPRLKELADNVEAAKARVKVVEDAVERAKTGAQEATDRTSGVNANVLAVIQKRLGEKNKDQLVTAQGELVHAERTLQSVLNREVRDPARATSAARQVVQHAESNLSALDLLEAAHAANGASDEELEEIFESADKATTAIDTDTLDEIYDELKGVLAPLSLEVVTRLIGNPHSVTLVDEVGNSITFPASIPKPAQKLFGELFPDVNFNEVRNEGTEGEGDEDESSDEGTLKNGESELLDPSLIIAGL